MQKAYLNKSNQQIKIRIFYKPKITKSGVKTQVGGIRPGATFPSIWIGHMNPFHENLVTIEKWAKYLNRIFTGNEMQMDLMSMKDT